MGAPVSERRVGGDDSTLSPDHPCYASLETYKQYLTPLLDDYCHVQAYREHADKLAKWAKCCPAGQETIARLRFDKAIPDRPEELPLPPVFAEGDCTPDSNWSYGVVQRGWFNDYRNQRTSYWEQTYTDAAQGLYDCCIRQFEACLREAGRAGGEEGKATPTSADSERCLQRFSPEYREQAAAETGATLPDKPAELVAPSGWTVITAWPDGAGSLDLGLLTAAALVVGFICGRAGRQRRRARFGSRLINGLFAGLVFLGIVALLPDTQPRSLLLALAGAIIVTLLRLLIRSFFLLRQREEDAPVP